MTEAQDSGRAVLERLAGAAAPQLAALPGGRNARLLALRRQALERALAAGLPSPHAESWKYTNLRRALGGVGFLPGEAVHGAASLDYVPSLLPRDGESFRLVFLNGFFRPEHSRLEGLPAGLRLAPLGKLLESEPELLEGLDLGTEAGRAPAGESGALVALNTALAGDGVVLRLSEGVKIERPIEVTFLASLAEQPIAFNPRLLLSLGKGAQATLVEQHRGLGTDPYLANHVADITLSRGAALTHLRVQEETERGFHLANSRVRLAEDARYETFALATGAALSRHEIHVWLEGRGAEVKLNGAYLLRDRQHADTTSAIEHRAEETVSRETYRGVLDGKSRAVFQGRIAVRPGARRSDARMLNRTLLLSPGAEIDCKPELEIYADDVECAHGATAGELEPEALFYLRSRGVEERRARALLVEGFLAEAAETLPEGVLRGALEERFRLWLEGI